MVVELLSHVLSGCPKLEPLTVVIDWKNVSIVSSGSVWINRNKSKVIERLKFDY